MGKEWRVGLHFIFVTIFFVATTNTCLGVRNITESCFEHERQALLKFKQSVTDSYDMLSSWVGNDCCSWERVRCAGGNVERLHLEGNYHAECLTSGEISTSLGELRHLKYLDLSLNYFQESPIPDFIGSLKQLTYLNLSYAKFGGDVPPNIGNLSNLKVLDLRSDPYYLKADDVAWISRLSSLEYLDLSRVTLTGAKNLNTVFYMIPSLKHLRLQECNLLDDDLGSLRNSSTTLSNIQHLDVGGNTFYSGRYTSILANMTSLRVLDLSYCSLNSSVPVFPNLLELDISGNNFKHLEDVGIWRQCHLKQLKMADNGFNGFLMEFTDSPTNMSECSQYALERLDITGSLNGTIPESLGRMTNLRGLYLSGNKLTCSLPKHIGSLRYLHVLDLSNNELTSEIPDSLGRLGSLQELRLSHNKLTCSIPESLGGLRLLQVLDLSYNELTGRIPIFLRKLTHLDLSYNHLNGSIPESFGRLEALTSLILESNKLTGPIPTSIGRLVLLQSLVVSSNFLNGTMPPIGNLSNLRYLIVGSNSLEGVVSEAHFANLSNLKYLNASYNNKLTFDFAHEWLPPFQLIDVDLSSCKIVNGFPQWLRNQRNLKSLLLSNSTISGSLPPWLRNLPVSSSINLSHNNLTGSLTNIPCGGTCNVTMELYLQNNIFNESIPRSLCKMTKLYALDLSRNKLTGRIPNCFIQGLSALFVLKLNGNNFSGELPREFWNLTDLSVIDLGENEFSGAIPEWIKEEVNFLSVLRLHRNNFTGRIPQSLCRNSGLQILDVAHNNLIGTIPGCLGKLFKSTDFRQMSYQDIEDGTTQVMKGVAMEYTKNFPLVVNLDLSTNKLVGEIPVELTALQALVGLNLSNNHLSGGIPRSIGNMTSLFSLDFSRNELSGLIPPSIANLTFLTYLDLSNNNLSGRIPTGSQLQTLEPSIYVGNTDLCGAPLSKNCSMHEDPTLMPKNIYKAHDEPNKVWFYLDLTCGFATGFWGFIMVLVFKKEWRHKLFMFAEDTIDKIYVVVMIRVNKMKRGRDGI